MWLGMGIDIHPSVYLGECCCTAFHGFQNLLIDVGALKGIHLEKPPQRVIETYHGEER